MKTWGVVIVCLIVIVGTSTQIISSRLGKNTLLLDGSASISQAIAKGLAIWPPNSYGSSNGKNGNQENGRWKIQENEGKNEKASVKQDKQSPKLEDSQQKSQKYKKIQSFLSNSRSPKAQLVKESQQQNNPQKNTSQQSNTSGIATLLIPRFREELKKLKEKKEREEIDRRQQTKKDEETKKSQRFIRVQAGYTQKDQKNKIITQKPFARAAPINTKFVEVQEKKASDAPIDTDSMESMLNLLDTLTKINNNK